METSITYLFVFVAQLILGTVLILAYIAFLILAGMAAPFVIAWDLAVRPLWRLATTVCLK